MGDKKRVAKSKEVTRSVEKSNHEKGDESVHDHDCKEGDYENEYMDPIFNY